MAILRGTSSSSSRRRVVASSSVLSSSSLSPALLCPAGRVSQPGDVWREFREAASSSNEQWLVADCHKQVMQLDRPRYITPAIHSQAGGRGQPGRRARAARQAGQGGQAARRRRAGGTLSYQGVSAASVSECRWESATQADAAYTHAFTAASRLHNTLLELIVPTHTAVIDSQAGAKKSVVSTAAATTAVVATTAAAAGGGGGGGGRRRRRRKWI